MSSPSSSAAGGHTRPIDDEIASLQAAKNAHAFAQDPPIEVCVNNTCKFIGCTCGSKCGCGIQDASTLLISCGECVDLKYFQ